MNDCTPRRSVLVDRETATDPCDEIGFPGRLGWGSLDGIELLALATVIYNPLRFVDLFNVFMAK